MSDKLEKFKKLFEVMKALENFTTKEEFLASYKAVLGQILEMEKKLIEKLNKDRDALKTDFGNARKIEKDDFDKIKNEVKQFTDKLFKEQSDNLNFLYDKVSNLKNGQDADEQKIIKEVIAQIPEPFQPDTAEQTRNKLETLKGKERLSKDAIDGLDEIIQELETKITKSKTFGGGGTSDAGVKFSLGRLVKTEVPTGLINGSNKVYTVGSSITAIISFGINGQVIHSNEYAKSGNTITFTTALPAELSGTRFEIIYI